MLGHQPALELEPVRQRAVEGAVDQRLHGPVGRGAARREGDRHLLDRGADRARGDDPVDEAPRERVARAQPAAEQHQLLRAPGADEPRQALAPPAARDQPEVGVLVPEARGLVGHDQVRHQHELEPAGEREPVHARDDRDRQRLDPVEDAVPEAHEGAPAHRIGRELLHRAQVRAGAERPPRRGEGDHPHARVALHERARAVEILEQLRADRVQPVGAVQRDARDAAAGRAGDRLEVHGSSLPPHIIV